MVSILLQHLARNYMSVVRPRNARITHTMCTLYRLDTHPAQCDILSRFCDFLNVVAFDHNKL